MTGFFNVYKEAGYTSHDVVAIVRKLTGGKVGHTGTLDPQAEGVLPICIGRATKLADMVMAEEKSYIAEVVLGIVTDTGDMTGQVLQSPGLTNSIPGGGITDTRVIERRIGNVSQRDIHFSEAAIQATVATFCGQQTQLPPMYSAIKVGGKKLYELARKGQTVERKPRQINIKSINVIKLEPEKNSFTIDVTCSKGTYIRSLCADIGEKLGTGATMGALLRTRSGAFTLDNAIKLTELKDAAANRHINDFLLSVETVLPFPRAYVGITDGPAVAMAKNGNRIPLDMVDMLNISNINQNTKVWLHSPHGAIGLFSIDKANACLRLEVLL